MIASEYGYTLEEFGKMTAREVCIALKNISIRKENEIRIQAKLHGVEIKENASVKKIKFDKDKDEFLTAQIEKMNKERFGNVPK